MGKIHDQWKKAKGELRPEQLKALPKDNYGDKMDLYEKLSEKIAAEAESLAKHLAEWEPLYKDVSETTYVKYIGEVRKIKPKPSKDFEQALADVGDLLKRFGKKTHMAWTKVKDSDIKKYQF